MIDLTVARIVILWLETVTKVLPHSSVSYAERQVLTGQRNAYVDSEQHTVLIASWQVNLSIAGMFLPCAPL